MSMSTQKRLHECCLRVSRPDTGVRFRIPVSIRTTTWTSLTVASATQGQMLRARCHPPRRHTWICCLDHRVRGSRLTAS